jgi:hypothetical protein
VQAHNSALDRDLTLLGREWLRNGFFANRSWARVWSLLQELQPEDPEFVDLGRKC